MPTCSIGSPTCFRPFWAGCATALASRPAGAAGLPGRHDTQSVHIGIEWLESVAFGHLDSIGERVLIIGVGNTAMDCCRTSLRLGAKDVKVMARKPRGFFKASDWELEDAEEERVEIVVNHSPKEFVIEDGKLKGMLFDLMEYDIDAAGKIAASRAAGEQFIPCDEVILAIGQDTAFPWVERDIGIEFDQWEVPVVDRVTYQSTREGVFFGGDAAFGPENIIWAVEHGHQAAISIHKHCHGEPVTERMPRGMNLLAAKMGIHEWSYSNDYETAPRRAMQHMSLEKRFRKLDMIFARCIASPSRPTARRRSCARASPLRPAISTSRFMFPRNCPRPAG